MSLQEEGKLLPETAIQVHYFSSSFLFSISTATVTDQEQSRGSRIARTRSQNDPTRKVFQFRQHTLNLICTKKQSMATIKIQMRQSVTHAQSSSYTFEWSLIFVLTAHFIIFIVCSRLWILFSN